MYQKPNQKWSQELQHYNEQLDLILEWRMQTEKAVKQWKDAKNLLELTESLEIDIDEKLQQEVQEKTETYEEEILEQKYPDPEFETDLEDYKITVEDLQNNNDNYNPPPV